VPLLTIRSSRLWQWTDKLVKLGTLQSNSSTNWLCQLLEYVNKHGILLHFLKSTHTLACDSALNIRHHLHSTGTITKQTNDKKHILKQRRKCLQLLLQCCSYLGTHKYGTICLFSHLFPAAFNSVTDKCWLQTYYCSVPVFCTSHIALHLHSPHPM
jgi:hypothetical protein